MTITKRDISGIRYINTFREDEMRECCSSECDNWDNCLSIGILNYMKILPIKPEDNPNKPWCKSYERDHKEE